MKVKSLEKGPKLKKSGRGENLNLTGLECRDEARASRGCADCDA